MKLSSAVFAVYSSSKKITRFVASAPKIHEKTSRMSESDDSEKGDAEVQDVDEDGDQTA